MPSVIDVPEKITYEEQALSEEHDLYKEQPQVHVVRPGFWDAVVAYARRRRVHRMQRTSSADHSTLRPMASPMARLAQEHPTLFLLGFFGIPHG
jgi:hypothetical protein